MERDLRVNVTETNSNKWVSVCCPAQWLSNKINKGQIFQNTNCDRETCQLDEPKISFIISSGTFTVESSIRWRAPTKHHWQTLQ